LFPSTPVSFKWSPSIRFLTWNTVSVHSRSHPYYMHCPSYSSWLLNQNLSVIKFSNIRWLLSSWAILC
jgi:hypothetical protein